MSKFAFLECGSVASSKS